MRDSFTTRSRLGILCLAACIGVHLACASRAHAQVGGGQQPPTGSVTSLTLKVGNQPVKTYNLGDTLQVTAEATVSVPANYANAVQFVLNDAACSPQC